MTRRRAWRLPQAADQSAALDLPGRSRVLHQILWSRGIRSRAEANLRFARGRSGFRSPEELPGVREACAAIAAARAAEARVTVFGDYDADGVTGSAILTLALRRAGIAADWYLPDRQAEGYGLNATALRELHSQGTRLVVTVDNGINAVAEAGVASDLGLGLIVTDHHRPGPALPQVSAIVHPGLPGSAYPFPGLSGAGVALKLALALLGNGASDLEAELFALAAVGTVADVVPLVDENRRIVSIGLEALNAAPAPPLAALIRASGLSRGQVDSDAIGYRLGPRLNAAGRMADAHAALRLLLAEDPAEISGLVEELETRNQRRKAETEAVLAQACERLGEAPGPVIFEGDPEWPVGLVGLVAGRLLERYWRPAFVAHTGGGLWRGSVRWPGWWPLGAHQALSACEDLLDRYGGHQAAGGFSVRPDRWEAMGTRLLALPGLPDPDAALPDLEIEAIVTAQELGPQLRGELDLLAPFGAGNPEPVLALLDAEIRDTRVLSGGRHLRVSIAGRSGALHGVAFDAAGALDWLRPGSRADLAFSLGWNVFQDMASLELRLVDVRPAQAEAAEVARTA